MVKVGLIELSVSIGLVVSLVVAWFSLAPWLPTQSGDLKLIDKSLALKSGDVFYEIGCGNARVCSYIARQNPDARVIGVELAFPFYLFSKLRGWYLGLSNMEIVFGNALKIDFSEADKVYVFGLKGTVNGLLKTKMENELKPGSIFISYIFSVDDWVGRSEKTVLAPGGTKINIYTR